MKITSSNGQFAVLYNTTDTTLDMSKYQLEYFNNYDLSKATSSRLIALSGSLPPHGYYLVNDSTMQLCHQMIVHSASLGFSSTAGFLGVASLNQDAPGGPIYSELLDYFAWSKSQTAGVQTLPSNATALLYRTLLDAQESIAEPGAGSWVTAYPSAGDPCKLVGISLVTAAPGDTEVELLPATDPPFVQLSPEYIEASSPTDPVSASANAGLMKPVISELLPNPAGTGTDTTDEYIEIYNPNSKGFDLSGYILVTGLTGNDTYVIPQGTILQPKAFTAFYSSRTRLGLSNSGSLAALYDTAGKLLTETKIYASAADGQAWALAGTQWLWSIKPTPGAANTIQAPVSKTKKSSTKSTKPSVSKTAASKAPRSNKPTAALAKTVEDEVAASAPIHAWALALVGCLAILYAVYEYRADIANRIFQFRKYVSARRANR